MGDKKIKVLMVDPYKHPCNTYLATSMKALKKAVSKGADEIGDVESKKIGRGVYIIYNRDKIFSELPPNRRVGDDIIAGTFYVLAVDKNGYPISLTDKLLKEYSERFWEIEHNTYEEAIEADFDSALRYLDELEKS